MTYTAPYVDDSGLHIPTYVDIRDDLVAQFKEIYGQDIYLDNDSQDYQMISAFALKTYDTMQLLQIVYNNHSPKTAVGTGLSSLVKLNGIVRKSASYSTCVLTLTGTKGTVIVAGVAEDSQGNKWDLPANLELTSDNVEVTAQCETIGAIEAPIGTITKISTPQRGWTAVTNAVKAVSGDPVETDEELRERQSISVALPGQNMLESTIAAIKAITGVTRCKVYDNDSNTTDSNGIPGHSIAAVVEGGMDDDVAKAIYLRKGPGGGTYGTTIGEYTNSDGLTNVINFFRPTYTVINVKVSLKKGTGYSSAIGDTIKANIENFIESLDIGNAVTSLGIYSAITAAITDTKSPCFSLTSVIMGIKGGTMGVADIPIDFNAVANVGTVSVEVTG